MTKTEAMKIVCVLFGSFPNSRFNEQNFESYAESILDLDADQCGLAAQRLIRTSKFLPSVAEIREATTGVVRGPRKTGAEAYAELKAACEKHGRYPAVWFVGDEMRTQKPWPPIPPDVAVAVRQTWGSWEACCADSEIESPSRARFIQAYDGMSERDRADLVSGVPLPAPQAVAPRLAVVKPKPPEPVPPKTLPRGQSAQAIAVPKQNTPAPVPIVAPRQPPGPTPFQGRRLSAEEIEAELQKRSAK